MAMGKKAKTIRRNNYSIELKGKANPGEKIPLQVWVLRGEDVPATSSLSLRTSYADGSLQPCQANDMEAPELAG